jgi:CheY-like chemotaxis protein
MCGRAPSVLLIEDDVDIRDSLQQVLEMEGYRVTPAGNGKEGLDALALGPAPCVVLLDLMMPVMNGWEFLQAKRDTPQAGIPVVVVSAAGERTQAAGAAAFLKKPVDLAVLLDLVRHHCIGSYPPVTKIQ